MPRSTQWIIDHADELADQFEAYEPKPEDRRDPEALRFLRQTVAARVTADRDLVKAVTVARDAGYSWAVIGGQLGTSGEAARQRYAQFVSHDGK